MFIISHPALVIAQCKAEIVGAFPALNARPISQLDEWLHEIAEALAAHDRAHPESPAAPFAVNQIVHKSNARLEEDMALTVKWKAPIVITSLGAREDVNAAVHGYGGLTLHDIINNRFAHKAIRNFTNTISICPISPRSGGADQTPNRTRRRAPAGGNKLHTMHVPRSIRFIVGPLVKMASSTSVSADLCNKAWWPPTQRPTG